MRRQVAMVALAALALVGAGCSVRRSTSTPAPPPGVKPTVSTIARSTCVELSLARTEFIAPSSPEAAAKAKAVLLANAPGYLEPSIEILAEAGGSADRLMESDAVNADAAVKLWLNEACAPPPTSSTASPAPTVATPGR